MSETSAPTNVMQALVNAGLNAFGVQIFCESLLQHPNPKPIKFFFPIRRKDCEGWVGVEVSLVPIPQEKSP